jgi:hypothetical protein
MSEIIIHSETALQSAIGDVREMFRAHRFLRLQVKAGKARSLDQNAISHCWYDQMAREDRQYDTQGHRRYCKLHHGVPIMRAEDSEFRAFYDSALLKLTYEQKLAAMDFVPVTSQMTKPQLSKYLEAVQADYGSRSIYLEFPNQEVV